MNYKKVFRQFVRYRLSTHFNPDKCQ